MSNTNHQVAHLWANQSKPSARSSNGNFSYDGATLYSYSTPIARLILGDDGKPTAALVTNRRFSATTSSKHMPAIHSALREGLTTYHVPSVHGDHDKNLQALVADYENAKLWLRRARDLYEFSYERLHSLAAHAEDYAVRFDLPRIHLDSVKDEAEIKHFRAERDARLNTPDAIAKRQKDRERRETRREAREAEEARQAAIRNKDAVAARRQGDPRAYLPWGLPVMLRLQPGHPEVLETSKGARVPLEDAKKVFRLAQEVHGRVEFWEPKLPLRVGDFRVDRIDPDGTIHAGCHVIPWAETERMAVSLGLIDPPPTEPAEMKDAA